jgi:PAS domain-containing protein
MQKESGSEQYAVLANRIRNSVEQYRATREVERTERRLRELTESMNDCIWMFDREWEELLFVSGYEGSGTARSQRYGRTPGTS